MDVLFLILNLIRFINFEGKVSLDAKGDTISPLDYQMYETVYDNLQGTDLSPDCMTLTALFLSSCVDDYDDSYVKVCDNMLSRIN